LEGDEKAVITVWLVEFGQVTAGVYDLGPLGGMRFIGNVAHLVGTDHTFTLEVKPPVGAVLTMERTTPARLDSVMNLR
jgi:archaellin